MSRFFTRNTILFALLFVVASSVPMVGMEHGADGDNNASHAALMTSSSSVPGDNSDNAVIGEDGLCDDDGAWLDLNTEEKEAIARLESVNEMPVHLLDGGTVLLKLTEKDMLTSGMSTFRELMQEQLDNHNSDDLDSGKFIIARVTTLNPNGQPCVSWHSAHVFNRYIFTNLKTVGVGNAVDPDDDVQAEYPTLMHRDVVPKYDLTERLVKPCFTSSVMPIKDIMRNPIQSSEHVEYYVYDPKKHEQGFTGLCTYKDLIGSDEASQKWLNFFCRNQYDCGLLRQYAYGWQALQVAKKADLTRDAGINMHKLYLEKAELCFGNTIDADDVSPMIAMSARYQLGMIGAMRNNKNQQINSFVSALKTGVANSWMVQEMRAIVGCAEIAPELLDGLNQNALLKKAWETKFSGNSSRLDDAYMACIACKLAEHAISIAELKDALEYLKCAKRLNHLLSPQRQHSMWKSYVQIFIHRMHQNHALGEDEVKWLMNGIEKFCAGEMSPCDRGFIKHVQAVRYYYGDGGVKQDNKAALQLFEESRMECDNPVCARFDEEGLVIKGMILVEGGFGVTQNREAAFKIFDDFVGKWRRNKQHLFSKAYYAALYARTRLQYEGFHGEIGRNYAEAFKGFQELYHYNANLKPKVIHQLGLCYMHGHGVEQDLGKAIEYFKEVATVMQNADARSSLEHAQILLGLVPTAQSSTDRSHVNVTEAEILLRNIGTGQSEAILSRKNYLLGYCCETYKTSGDEDAMKFYAKVTQATPDLYDRSLSRIDVLRKREMQRASRERQEWEEALKKIEVDIEKARAENLPDEVVSGLEFKRNNIAKKIKGMSQHAEIAQLTTKAPSPKSAELAHMFKREQRRLDAVSAAKKKQEDESNAQNLDNNDAPMRSKMKRGLPGDAGQGESPSKRLRQVYRAGSSSSSSSS